MDVSLEIMKVSILFSRFDINGKGKLLLMERGFAKFKGAKGFGRVCPFPCGGLGCRVLGPAVPAACRGHAGLSARWARVQQAARPRQHSLVSGPVLSKWLWLRKVSLSSDFKTSPKFFQCISEKFRLKGLLLPVSWAPLVSDCRCWDIRTKTKLCRM